MGKEPVFIEASKPGDLQPDSLIESSAVPAPHHERDGG